MSMELKFETIETVEEKDYHIFKAETTKKRNPKGKESNFVKLHSPNWVSAVIFDETKEKFVLVKQYRHGTERVLYEIPCGMVEEGEDTLKAALREAKEEVGLYDVKSITKLYTHAANPAFMDNEMTAYFIVGKTDKNLVDPDENEFIEISYEDYPTTDRLLTQCDKNVMLRLAWELTRQYLK